MTIFFLRKDLWYWPAVYVALLVICHAQSFPVSAQPAKPILVSVPTSTRAVALDAVNLAPEPFYPRPVSLLYGPDEPTRIILFVLNLSLKPGQDASALRADAEDAAHRHYNLEVEYVGKIFGQDWLSQVNLRLDGGMGDLGDVLVGITYEGVTSNRVRVAIGHVGGGPEDDAGAAPTPAPPYTISGRITSGATGLRGVSVLLGGTQTATVTTGDDGSYLFTVTTVGNYTISPSKKFYTITPSGKSFDNLSGNRTAGFSASPSTHTISGKAKDDQGNVLVDFPVTLRSSSNGDSAPRSVRTGNGGDFTFTEVVAGRGYVLTPSDTSLLVFTPHSISELDGDVAVNFGAALQKYSISGVITDRSGRGVGEVAVALTGMLGLSTTTDVNGRYSFNNLPAGKLYNVSVGKIDYILSPGSRSYNLLKDERADFTAVRQYKLRGRVTDTDGKGIYGILMKLGGPEPSAVFTDVEGYYSITVTTPGDYKLTPLKEQDFYQFSPPSQSFNALSDNQFTNFTAALVIASPTHVLEFDGTQMSVDYGVFWPHDTTVGNFFWEFWAMPGENTQGRYILSDGYGGAHTLLFGFNHGPRGYNLSGNIWNGTRTVSFGSDEGPSVGEWGHYAVGWDGKNIITYYDGVPVGKTPFGGPRVSLGTGHGSTMLLIGGSNHQNLIGRIAQVRGYEENNPRESSPESSFAPQTVFSVEGQLLSYYFRPAERVADLSNGYNGGQHSGWPRGMKDFYFSYSCPGCPIPKFVIDPTAPDFSNQSNPGKVKTLFFPPPPTPGGARIFDSFSRDNATYILAGKGGLGTSETGTAGAKTWQSNVSAAQPQPFGILGGRAVLLGADAALAWVLTGSNANLNLSVERAVGAFGSGVNTGLSFRVVDKNNFFFAYTTNDEANSAAPKRLTLGYYLSGTRTVIANDVAMPSGSWGKLRVETLLAGSINVFADNALVHSTNSTVHSLATGAGIFNHAAGTALSNRWDNFTVLDVP